MPVFKILTNLKNYEFICKRRGHHEPDNKKHLHFLENAKFPTETNCVDCGCDLKLELDDIDPNMYWIKEL